MGNDIEVWKDFLFDGQKTYYQISSYGRVSSNYKGRITIRKLNDDGNGYLRISLAFNGDKFPKKVHRLVALSFILNPENLPEVNHLDGNKMNNRVNNLEWTSKKNNAAHAAKMGKLNRGNRKLPPIAVGKFFAGILLKSYSSMGTVVKDGYPRISVQRAAKSGKNYRGFFWKYLENAS